VKKYVLWDVDGTLLLNGPRAGSLYDEAIEYVAGIETGGVRPAEHGKVDGQIIAERLAEYGLDADLHDAVTERLEQLAQERHSGPDRREVAPGVRDALEAVAAAGWTNALLTGNSRVRAQAKLSGAGLEPDLFDWDSSFFGDRARARTEVTAAAAVALGEHPHVIVGDTPSDDWAAAEAGIPFIAVATGIYPAEDLRKTGALAVLDDLVRGRDALLAELERLGSLTPSP
jgi:phosphoglycolate phosphatase-like HAD superfamily hydrolase